MRRGREHNCAGCPNHERVRCNRCHRYKEPRFFYGPPIRLSGMCKNCTYVYYHDPEHRAPRIRAWQRWYSRGKNRERLCAIRWARRHHRAASEWELGRNGRVIAWARKNHKSVTDWKPRGG